MNHRTRLPLIEPDVRISRIRLSVAVRRFASFFPVGSMVRHPIQAVSFPQLLAAVLGGVSLARFFWNHKDLRERKQAAWNFGFQDDCSGLSTGTATPMTICRCCWRAVACG